MYYKHNKDLFLYNIFTQKLVKNGSQNIMNYILNTGFVLLADIF